MSPIQRRGPMGYNHATVPFWVCIVIGIVGHVEENTTCL